MNNIEELLERYFEGQTSAEEEATLRRFFTSGDVPENLVMYKPLFAYFDDEIRKANRKTVQINENKQVPTSRKIILWISGAAACAAILVGMFFFTPQSGKCPVEGDYVIIDGRCYTDAKTIRSATLHTLREISDNDISGKKQSEATRIIENQLKEFDSFFDE